MKTKTIKGKAFSLPQGYNKNKFNKANFGRSFLKRYFYFHRSEETATKLSKNEFYGDL